MMIASEASYQCVSNQHYGGEALLFIHEVREAAKISDDLSDLSLSHIYHGSLDCE
jgi:hypothetical protein